MLSEAYCLLLTGQCLMAHGCCLLLVAHRLLLIPVIRLLVYLSGVGVCRLFLAGLLPFARRSKRFSLLVVVFLPNECCILFALLRSLLVGWLRLLAYLRLPCTCWLVRLVRLVGRLLPMGCWLLFLWVADCGLLVVACALSVVAGRLLALGCWLLVVL